MESTGFTLCCEKLLAESLAEVATELRLVNVIDLISYVQAERYTNLEDLVNSSAELYFKQGALRYAWWGDIDVVWDALPIISLNMEFCWSGVTAFFNLRLDAARAGVDLQHLRFHSAFQDGGDELGGDADERLKRLSSAIAASRLTPPCRPPFGQMSNQVKQ